MDDNDYGASKACFKSTSLGNGPNCLWYIKAYGQPMHCLPKDEAIGGDLMHLLPQFFCHPNVSTKFGT